MEDRQDCLSSIVIMAGPGSSHHRIRAAGASVGPLSLLLLPKCPLCLVPLLALIGVTVPATMGLWILAGGLMAGWLVLLMMAARDRPSIRIAGWIAAAAGFAALELHNAFLLLPAVLAMTVTGIAASRSCSLTRHSREA